MPHKVTIRTPGMFNTAQSAELSSRLAYLHIPA